ncbi:MAG TPA: TonB-dependent receptor [Flavobacterium sp.]|jgi:hypothetical protein
MRYRLFYVLFFIAITASAQTKGKVTGVITDKEAGNQTLPFANIQLKDTTIGTSSDENGNYTITAEPGNYIIQFSFLGYETAEEPITIVAGETLTLNKTLGSGNYTLKDVVVQSNVNREKESALLVEQKNAVEIKTSIGAQELSRKGVSDVATAVTKTTGITKQEGSGNIYVRGLGDRYNSTSMNGLPVASNDPERKNIELEIFPTNIVEYVSIDKVYSSRMYGDFAGGNVDIISRDYSGSGFLNLEIGSSINSNAVANDDFKLSDGPDFFGFKTASRPNTLSAYTFENGLNPVSKAPYAGSLSLSGGKSYSFNSGGKLSLFGVASFGNEFSSYKEGISRSVNAQGVPTKDFFDYDNDEYNTLTTGMANVGYRFNPANKLSYNFLFINSSTQQSEDYRGLIVDIANENNGLQTRRNYVKNTLLIHQLLGDHTFSERTKLNWGLSYNTITGDMPDRVQNTLRLEENGYLLSNNSETDNHRYFQSLKEDEIAARVTADYKFMADAEGDYKGKITLGYNGRYKTRDFEATQFNFGTSSSQALTIVDPENLDAFYNQENFANGYFTISTFRGAAGVPGALDPQTYNGEQNVHGFFGNIEYKLNAKLTAMIGVKGEMVVQKVAWVTQINPIGDEDEFDKFAFLPNLILKYSANDRHNFRLAASKTYTLPQFKERARFVYERVTESYVGNPSLYPSDNYNMDLKWEFFPKNDEIISLTGFGKYILNPINEFTLASSTPIISWANTGDYGYVAGAEFEYRKLLYATQETNANRITAGFNASWMYTSQELDSEKVAKETPYSATFTNSEDGFTGASDLLLNGDISFIREWNEKNNNISATVAYNYFSDRIYALGTDTRGNLVDKTLGTMDVIIKSKLSKNLGIGLSAKNILDPAVERVQENANGDVTTLHYKKGVNFNLNINYQF